MAAFLTYVVLRGPNWLRALFLALFAALLLFGCVQTLGNFPSATERQIPAHVHRPHTKTARYFPR